jgi:hypothetical protein
VQRISTQAANDLLISPRIKIGPKDSLKCSGPGSPRLPSPNSVL